MDGRKTVLKIGFAHSTADDIAREITALTCYGGKDAVALIEHHAADGALLLARARIAGDVRWPMNGTRSSQISSSPSASGGSRALERDRTSVQP